MSRLITLIVAVSVAACAGSTTGPNGPQIPSLTGHWCGSAPGGGFYSAMTLVQSGSIITGNELEFGYPFNAANTHSTTVTGAVTGTAISISMPDFELLGPHTFTALAPGVSGTPAGVLTLMGGPGVGGTWQLDDGSSVSPLPCAGHYP